MSDELMQADVFKTSFMQPAPRSVRVALLVRATHPFGRHTYRIHLGDRLYRCSLCTQTRNV